MRESKQISTSWARVAAFLQLCILSFIPFSGTAATTPLVEIDTNAYEIGDPIYITIRVNSDEGRWIWPGMGQIGGLELLDDEVDSSIVDGSTEIVRQLTYIGFDSGAFIFPPQQFTLIADGDSAVFETSGIPLYIGTPPLDQGMEIRPNRDIQEIKYRKTPWILLAFIIASLLALIAWLIYQRYFKKEKAEEPEAVRVLPKPVFEHAMERLANLEAKKLWQHDKTQEYFVELSDILREYIEFRYELPALESPTAELMDMMGEGDHARDDLKELRSVLQLSDQVKFARFKPLPPDCQKVMEQTRGFVQRTKPGLDQVGDTQGLEKDDPLLGERMGESNQAESEPDSVNQETEAKDSLQKQHD